MIRVLIFQLALLSATLGLVACSWVDSTGVQSPTEPTNEALNPIPPASPSPTVRPDDPSNHAPTVESEIPDIVLSINTELGSDDQRYNLGRYFSDPDGHRLEFSVFDNSLPTSGHLEIDSEGRLTGTPTEADIGQYSVGIIASDGFLSVEQFFTLTIISDTTGISNAPPIIDLVEDIMVSQGSEIDIPIRATDPENDTITMSLGGNVPYFIEQQQTDDSLILSGRARVSGSFPIQVTATDGNASSMTSFMLFIIARTNTPPQVDDIPNRIFNGEFEYDVSEFFFDPDNDEISYTAINLPSGVGIDERGTIRGTSSSANRGNHFITVFADDGFEEIIPDSFRLRIR